MPVDANAAKAIFMIALEKTEPAERAAYLSEACGNDDELRQRVEILLKAHEDPGSFMKSPVAGSAAVGVATVDEPVTEGPGTVIGPYKLLQQIGEGGMGTVFMAEQVRKPRMPSSRSLKPCATPIRKCAWKPPLPSGALTGKVISSCRCSSTV